MILFVSANNKNNRAERWSFTGVTNAKMKTKAILGGQKHA
jgi:hypothetical protein